jgi:hypothetical protein
VLARQRRRRPSRSDCSVAEPSRRGTDMEYLRPACIPKRPRT